MGQEGLLALATFAAFGVVSVVLYFLVIRPALPDDDQGRRAVQQPRMNNGGTQRARPASDNRNNATDHSSNSGAIGKILVQCSSAPSHINDGNQSSDVLVDGLVAFRHTKAAGQEQSKQETASQNRKERARILSRMLALEGKSVESGPPIRGSTLVISIPVAEVSCPKLRRVLYLFSTYYNLLLILVVSNGTAASEVGKATKDLRGKPTDTMYLDEDCLPPHRIVAASTTAGRIAFVRQLSKVEITLDFDGEVKEQLTRFGYRVINYKRSVSEKGASQLGMQLIST